MMQPRTRFIVLGLIVAAGVLVAAGLVVSYRRPATISESEAIRLAEEFIVRNGYTDLPADPDRRTLTSEPVVFSSSVEEELQQRHDTLERRADLAVGGADGWIVYFRYKGDRHHPPARRTVVMDGHGRHLQMIHQDAF